jgi:hypothetical protein
MQRLDGNRLLGSRLKIVYSGYEEIKLVSKPCETANTKLYSIARLNSSGIASYGL